MSKLSVHKVRSMKDRELPIFAELEEFFDRIRARAFKVFAKRGFGDGSDVEDWLTAQREICWSAAELVEEDDEFEIKVALAGFDAENITVTAMPRSLIIKATRQNESAARAAARVHWSDFSSEDVYRQITLSAEIDVDKVEAEYSNGMLEIEAPKKNVNKKAHTKVKVSSAA